MYPEKNPRQQNELAVADEPSDRFGRLFGLISDAVIELEIVDGMPIVRSTNPAFEEIFGYDRETVRGESLNEFIIPDEYDGQAEAFDERTAEGEQNHAIVSRKTATGVRDFLYRGVPYERGGGRDFAFAIYSDITEQQRYEKHIQVIHRILRHNLRNDLSVILGAASQIQTTTDDQTVSDLAGMVDRHAKTLGAIGEETRTLEKILTANRTPSPVGLASICRSVVESASDDWPSASITTDLPETLVVSGIQELETAIKGLVSCAVIHNTGHPRVRLTGRRTEDRIAVEITDNGPGIPAHELTPLLDGTEITQLQHGSGLGLWLARCAVEASDGQIEYERTADERTVVRLLFRPAR